MESPEHRAPPPEEEEDEASSSASSSSSGSGGAPSAAPAGMLEEEEEEEEGQPQDAAEDNTVKTFMEHWKVRLLRYCKALKVTGLRQLLPQLSPEQVCAGLNDRQYSWQAQETALSTVLGHLEKDANAPAKEQSADLATEATEAVRLLLQARADPNNQDTEQHWPVRKPLAQCTGAGAADAARLLLEAKADLELERTDHYRHGSSAGVMGQVVARAHVAVLDVLVGEALRRGQVPRDVLHAASRRGCQLAGECLDAAGIRAERTLEDSGDMPALTFSFDHLVWLSRSSGAEAPKVVLARGDIARWPCEAMLCDVSRDAAGQALGTSDPSASSSSAPPTAMDRLVAVQPGIRERLQSRDKFEYCVGRVFCLPAEGSLPMIYLLCTCLDPSPCKALYTRGIEQFENNRSPGIPCGCMGTEEVLLKAFLRAFRFAQEYKCPRLAVPPLSTAPGGFYSPEECARIFLNAVLIHFRTTHKPEGQLLEEISIVVSRREDYDAYRAVLTRLSASGERLRFFRDLGAGLRDTACPQPSRKAPVNQLQDAVLSEESAPARRCRELAVGAHAAGFKVEGLLSAEECRSVIDAAESAGMESVGWEYVPSYRDCRRAIFHDAQTAARIWRRLAPLLRRDDLHELRPIGWDTEGVWAPRGLNECLRVSRYDCSGKFAMHRDGPFVVSQDTRSIFTILVYLNEDFSGGATAFEGESEGDEPDVVQPTTGSALVFTHDARHEGRVVNGGSKYVLRTDLMFHRVDNLGLKQQGTLGLEDPLYQQCEALYRESIRLQNDNDPQGSTERYLEALEMQAQLASVRRRREGSNGSLPDAVWALIFRHLGVREAVECAALGRRARRLALDGEAWRDRYARRWEAAPRTSSALASWYSLFKYRCAADECWRTACFEVGFRVTRYAMLGNQPALKLRTLDPYADHIRQAHCQGQTAVLVGGLFSAISQIRGHYWGAHSGFKNYYVGKEALRPPFRGAVTGLRGAFQGNDDRSPDVEVFLELMRWTFAFGFEEPCWPLKHPLLLAVPPHLKAEARTEMASALELLVATGLDPDEAYKHRHREAPQYSVPYLLLESSSSLALQAAGQATGVHVHLAELCSVAAVVDGAAMDPAVFPMPTGLNLDQSAMDLAWALISQEPHGPRAEGGRAATEEVRASALSSPLESLHRLVTEAAREVFKAAGLTGVSPAPTVVVTADGGAREGDWSALEIVDGMRAALASAGFVPAAVDPAGAVVQGAVLRASTPDGRSRFRSAEGTPPPPPAPGLCRW